MDEMKTAKLLICYHKPDTLIKDEIFTPIHVGRAIAKQRMDEDDPKLKWLLENMIGDDTGENISLQNGSYNELTSLYWAWKNYDELGDPDYIGLMHYRRHFVLKEGEIKVYSINEMDSPHYFDYLNYSPEKLLALFKECDFVCHLGKVDGIYKHYLANHRVEDMELVLKILDEKYPEYSDVAKEYMAQNIGNFCNMFIFPKDMFFEYCEFIFSILEEFSQRTDVSEKRFFISERLTGIFIFDKMKQGLKYKVLPINFVAEKINIPVAYPLRKDNLYAVLLSVISALVNANKDTSFTFYMMHGADINEDVEAKFNSVCKKYPFCRFEFIESELSPEYYPIEISEKLPKVNKIIWFNEKALAMHDLAEFFRTCSVDDYYISGIPETYAMNDSEKRKLSGDIFVLNCARFRKYKIYENALEMINENSCVEILNTLCNNNIGYFAEWFITLAGSADFYCHTIISKTKNRGQLQLEATWKPVLYYGENDPWSNIQGVYSNFWWNYTAKTPFVFAFPKSDSLDAVEMLNDQQRELNHIGCINRKMCGDDYSNDIPDSYYNILMVNANDPELIELGYKKQQKALKNLADYQIRHIPVSDNSNGQHDGNAQNVEWNNAVSGENNAEEKLTLRFKIKRYYKQFGFKRSVKRVFEKLRGK